MAQGLGSRNQSSAPRQFPDIPGYELIDRLGEGGMGEVFLARQLSLDREVAVKVVRRELLTEEWFVERLEREARLLARLRNPHLVTVHDFLRLPDGTAAVVMELVEGGNLRDRLRGAASGLPSDEALTIIRQVASALAVAHAEGVVHRDIKPENILLDSEARVRVSDFGMALSLAPGAPRLTRTGAAAGTPGYLAPEQFTGTATDARVDIFALGVLLYEMLTGRLPLGSFEPPRVLRPEVPAAVDATVLRALKPDPAARPQTVAEFLALLDGSIAVPPVATVQPIQSVSRRTMIAGSLLAGLAGGATWYFLRPPAPAKSVAAQLAWLPLPWPADLAKATVSGSWRLDGDTLVSSDEVCIFTLADTLPMPCRVKLAFRRLGGSESIALFFRHPTAGFGSAELDGWSDHLSGIQSIDGRTTQGEDGFTFTVTPGRDHELDLELGPEEARLTVDGRLSRTYRLAGRKLSVVTPWGWNPGLTGPALALGTYKSPMRFSQIQLAKS